MSEYRFDVSKLEPLIAKPHSSDNRALARECKDVKIDRIYWFLYRWEDNRFSSYNQNLFGLCKRVIHSDAGTYYLLLLKL
ncbi:hypothetical protein SOVF_180900 [Spinacia oleracea]|nr:hypothetical protein SOVF_180900 [Spinacia oleracea]